jgi:hypothetical protein
MNVSNSHTERKLSAGSEGAWLLLLRLTDF